MNFIQNNKNLWISGTFIFALLSLQLWDVIYFRQLTGFLDNHVHYVSYQFFFSHLFEGRLPLWSAAHNGGQALWPLVEMHSLFDPPVWFAFIFSKILNFSGFYAFELAIFAWLWLFAFGCYLLARELSFSQPLALIAALMTGCSYLAVLAFMQANGLLIHVYITPWLLWLLIKYTNGPSIKKAFVLGFSLGIWLASYQFTLCLIGGVTFIVVYYGTAKSIPWNRTHYKYSFWIILGGLPFALGLANMAFYVKEIVPVARMMAPSSNTGLFDLSFLGPIIARLPEWDFTKNAFIYDTNRNLITGKIRHELFIYSSGFAYAILALFGIYYWKNRAYLKLPTTLQVSLNYFLTILFLYSGPAYLLAKWGTEDGVILNFRNWRFLQPYLLMSLSFLTISALQILLQRKQLPKTIPWFMSALASMAVVLSIIFYIPSDWFKLSFVEHHVNYWGVLWHLIIPTLLVAILFSFQKELSAKQIAYALVICISVDVTLFNRLWISKSLPRLTEEVRRKEPQIKTYGRGLTKTRTYEFPILEFAPFHKEGAAIWHYPTLRTNPEAAQTKEYNYNVRTLNFFYPSASYWFETKQYHQFSNLSVPNSVKRYWGGVERSVLNIFYCADNLSAIIPKLVGGTLKSEKAFSKNTLYLPDNELSNLTLPNENCSDSQQGQVDLLINQPDHLKIRVSSPRDGAFTIANGFDPRWKATTNNTPSPIFSAFGAFQAVPIHKGETQIELFYRPWGYILTALLRMLWLGIFIALVIKHVRGQFPSGS